MKTRLFIGNLAPSITDAELREKFESLFAYDKSEIQVGDVEVRSKNENNYFGFVDVHCEDSNAAPQSNDNKVPLFLRKHIDLMNNTKWKGYLIKVQPAKESFLNKLKREQDDQRHATETFAISTNGNDQKFGMSHKHGKAAESNRNIEQANDVLRQMSREKEFRKRKGGRSNFTEERNDSSGHCGFEIVDSTKVTNANKTSSNRSESIHKLIRASSDDSDSDTEDEIKDGIQKFKGIILSYPEALPSPSVCKPDAKQKTSDILDYEAEKQTVSTSSTVPLIQEKLISLAFDRNLSLAQDTKTLPTKQPCINFKKSKQEKSDLIRLQSLEKLKELKTHRNNVIKTSLSSVTAAAPLSKHKKTIHDMTEDGSVIQGSKRPKMTLFDDEDTDEDSATEEKNRFALKKQFEGAEGQKLLELKTRWANDDRFKIDERFKETSEGKYLEPDKLEKEKQFNILTDILGKTLDSSRSTTTLSRKDEAVIMRRYDPEVDENISGAEEWDQVHQKDEPTSMKNAGNEQHKITADSHADKKAEPIRSIEPTTYKTASNLKTLFSANAAADKGGSVFLGDNSTPKSFSILAAFASTNEKNEDASGKKNTSAELSGPRSFWQSNPFKYDSSDDEEEDITVKVMKPKETVASKPATNFHTKVSFFFSANDSRFDGVEDFFLKDDVGPTGEKLEVKPIDFAEKRRELKSIVKAKIRNTRRKDEKRTLAIKRAIRKRKSKSQAKHHHPAVMR